MLKLFSNWLKIGLLVSVGSDVGYGSSIIYCYQNNQKFCHADLDNERVGDRIKIINQHVEIIAIGKVIERNGNVGRIKIVKKKSQIKSGNDIMPLLNSGQSDDEWAASFSFGR